MITMNKLISPSGPTPRAALPVVEQMNQSFQHAAPIKIFLGVDEGEQWNIHPALTQRLLSNWNQFAKIYIYAYAIIFMFYAFIFDEDLFLGILILGYLWSLLAERLIHKRQRQQSRNRWETATLIFLGVCTLPLIRHIFLLGHDLHVLIYIFIGLLLHATLRDVQSSSVNNMQGINGSSATVLSMEEGGGDGGGGMHVPSMRQRHYHTPPAISATTNPLQYTNSFQTLVPILVLWLGLSSPYPYRIPPSVKERCQTNWNLFAHNYLVLSFCLFLVTVLLTAFHHFLIVGAVSLAWISIYSHTRRTGRISLLAFICLPVLIPLTVVVFLEYMLCDIYLTPMFWSFGLIASHSLFRNSNAITITHNQEHVEPLILSSNFDVTNNSTLVATLQNQEEHQQQSHSLFIDTDNENIVNFSMGSSTQQQKTLPRDKEA